MFLPDFAVKMSVRVDERRGKVVGVSRGGVGMGGRDCCCWGGGG